MGETETLTIFFETRPRRAVGTSRDRDVETETTTLVPANGNFVIYFQAEPSNLYHAHIVHVGVSTSIPVFLQGCKNILNVTLTLRRKRIKQVSSQVVAQMGNFSCEFLGV